MQPLPARKKAEVVLAREFYIFACGVPNESTPDSAYALIRFTLFPRPSAGLADVTLSRPCFWPLSRGNVPSCVGLGIRQ